MMRGGVPWLLHEFPDVVDQKIVKSADLFLENFIGLHYRSQIAIVDAVKWIELNGVTLEMPGQEGLCYFLMPHVVPAGALYVIEEHREMRHVKTVGQHVYMNLSMNILSIRSLLDVFTDPIALVSPSFLTIKSCWYAIVNGSTPSTLMGT